MWGNAMNDINQTLKDLRPSLRKVAPQTFWFSIGFGIFNTIIGVALFNLNILVRLKVVGVVPIKLWGIVFLVHGLTMLASVLANNWRLTRSMHLVGIAIKTAWWLEMLTVFIAGSSPFLLYIWSLLLFLQVIVCIYFTPRMRRD